MTQVESWKNVGNKIRHLRKINQLTIRQLANGCDLSANAISLVERGEVAPSVATLCKIARALGVSASSLFQDVCTPDVVLSRAGGTEPEFLGGAVSGGAELRVASGRLGGPGGPIQGGERRDLHAC